MRAVLQVRHDAGATLGLVDGGDVEIAFAARTPAHAFAGSQAGAARGDFHFIGNDEGAVEADAELADQLRILLLVARQLDTASSRDRPIPLSEIVIVRAALS
ncbi:hypothetical protein G6F64_015209 [Rhizopus arrhizus]|uniref:Uncharacterized protein n=1 Tax=Rhizopus oryzae TaxID=64495 RepID=A0A9P6WSI0_RHIOR|nr:hypothetical protein G6F64_015209 [Rhizopus arrhizus]